MQNLNQPISLQDFAKAQSVNVKDNERILDYLIKTMYNPH